jgi:hypothetical protein
MGSIFTDCRHVQEISIGQVAISLKRQNLVASNA